MSQSRGAGIALPANPIAVGLPAKVFLYTIDQIGTMLSLTPKQVAARYVYFEGRSIGSRKKDLMVARNIAAAEDPPEWRIAERELIRWMRHKGFRYYDRGAFSS